MARLRHFAIVVKDLERSARFYEQVFDLKCVGREQNEMGAAVYLSDGVVNLALLRYASAAASGSDAPERLIGAHHFGFQVDDLEKTQSRIEAAGGKFFFDLGKGKGDVNFERKFRDPDGVIFDISEKGWLGGGGE